MNPERGFIDLSQKRIPIEVKAAAKERYYKSRAVHSIMRQVISVTGRYVKNDNGKMSLRAKYTMKQLYQLFGWEMGRKFGH